MKKIIVIAACIFLVGCYSEQDVNEKIAETLNQVEQQIKRAVDSCEQDLSYQGMLMDEGCLEYEFSYDGDFYNCETGVYFRVVDGDCVLSSFGIW